jgi:hypothetical protein
MSETAAVADGHETRKAPSMGKFERFLTLWVALCIIVGIGLGQAVGKRARRRFRAKQAPVHEHSREIACLPGAWRLGPSARTRDPR